MIESNLNFDIEPEGPTFVGGEEDEDDQKHGQGVNHDAGYANRSRSFLLLALLQKSLRLDLRHQLLDPNHLGQDKS